MSDQQSVSSTNSSVVTPKKRGRKSKPSQQNQSPVGSTSKQKSRSQKTVSSSVEMTHDVCDESSFLLDSSSRQEEKQEFKVLNDRLVNVFAKNRDLEARVIELNNQLETTELNKTDEIDVIKNHYSMEVKEVKELLNQESRQRAELTLNIQSLEKRLDDFRVGNQEKDKTIEHLQIEMSSVIENLNSTQKIRFENERELARTEKDLEIAVKTLKDLEMDNKNIPHLQNRIDTLTNEIQIMNLKANTLCDEADELRKVRREYANARDEIDQTVLQKVELQNNILTLQEKIDSDTRLHNEQLKTLRSSRICIEDQVETKMKTEFESTLGGHLEELRAEIAADVEQQQQMLEDTFIQSQTLFHNQIEQLKTQLNLKNDSYEKEKKRRSELEKQIDNMLKEQSQLRDLINQRERDLTNLRNLLDSERDEHASMINEQIELASDQRNQITSLQTKLSNIGGDNVSMAGELAIYDSLLIDEEKRLNIESSSQLMGDSVDGSARRGTKRRLSRKLGISSKKPRNTSAFQNRRIKQITKSRISNDAKSTVPIDIIEQDMEGNFIRIRNNSEQDMKIGGWTLKRTIISGSSSETDKEQPNEILYKFHNNLQLRAKTTATVYSMKCGAGDNAVQHEPPKAMIMKNQNWSAGDNVKSSLVDGDGVDVAYLTSRLERVVTNEEVIEPRQTGVVSWLSNLFHKQ